MQIKWLRSAEADLLELEVWLLENASGHLQSTAKGIFDAAASLSALPHRGRPGLVEGTRELLILGLPYVLVYVVLEDCVSIIRLLHQHQQWPAE